ncbi:MAG: hypothetical protein JNM89_14280 [Hyphomicrobiaceae bacterium]|nr:hypothetical protein [Hyphomicrobiaceae bacterium]
MEFLDRIPWSLAIIAALTLGLAPFFPEPHIWEKLKMLSRGTLTRPIDIFDLCFHAVPWAILALKAAREAMGK